MNKRLVFLLIFIYVFYIYIHAQNETVTGKGMVVSAHPEASKIGASILKKGGNAIDAAIAVEFSLAVCYPSAGNIGGGGFMLIRNNKGKTNTLDYREKAPRQANKDMFLDTLGYVIENASVYTSLAVGVPGTVDGMIRAYEKYGSLDFKDLIQPAIDLAYNGFEITEQQAGELNRLRADFERYNKHKVAFVKDGEWKEKDVLKQKELGHTLELIRDYGRDGFYSGETADKIVNFMKSSGGIITKKDLSQYAALWRDPVVGSYKGYEVFSMAPPSSGGIALVQLLKMIEPFDIKSYGMHSKKAVHLMAAAEKRVYADRAVHLGDPNYFRVPKKGLLEESYIKNRFLDFNAEKAKPSSEISEGTPKFYESEQTTHYSIVDEKGNAVSATTTINRAYGSRRVVPGAGFLLNNEMDDFSIKPGYPNSYGLVGGKANQIESGKRMLSSMTPTILTKNNKLFMVVGSPGGSTIITSVFQTILNVIEFGKGMQEAVDAPRFHHQWLPDILFFEKGKFNDDLLQSLIKLGYLVKERSPIGRVDAILVSPDGMLEGGADSRGDDTAIGVD